MTKRQLKEIAKILKATRGASAQIARDLFVRPASVSMVLAGRRRSASILAAAEKKAAEIASR